MLSANVAGCRLWLVLFAPSSDFSHILGSHRLRLLGDCIRSFGAFPNWTNAEVRTLIIIKWTQETRLVKVWNGRKQKVKLLRLMFQTQFNGKSLHNSRRKNVVLGRIFGKKIEILNAAAASHDDGRQRMIYYILFQQWSHWRPKYCVLYHCHGVVITSI